MRIQPDIGSFRSTYEAGKPQVAWVVLGADLETPVSAMLKLARDKPNSFLLESVEGGAVRGRYSFIGLNPDLIWRCFGDKAEINRDAENNTDTFTPCEGPV
ncbi:MAG: anthranilate synthase component I, partial [Rhodospirillales bacterium]|nr:anthranilate synthase component I [Rhodospirillales bacterium]